MRRSDEALAAKDPNLALSEAQLAAEATALLSPYPDRGYARIEALAQDAEARGDDEGAEAAWRAMRTAQIATKGPLVDTRARRVHAEQALARIGTRHLLIDAARIPGSARLGEAELRARIARDPTPPSAAFAILGAGAALFAASAAALALEGPRLPRGPGLRMALGAALGVGLVALALARLF